MVHFGTLPIRIRGILYYSLAPVEQRAWAKSMTHGIPNMMKRIMYALPTVLPSFITSIVLYKWSNYAYAQSIRKDPKLYENDK